MTYLELVAERFSGPWLPRVSCGTRFGALLHRAHDERPCWACVPYNWPTLAERRAALEAAA